MRCSATSQAASPRLLSATTRSQPPRTPTSRTARRRTTRHPARTAPRRIGLDLTGRPPAAGRPVGPWSLRAPCPAPLVVSRSSAPRTLATVQREPRGETAERPADGPLLRRRLHAVTTRSRDRSLAAILAGGLDERTTQYRLWSLRGDLPRSPAVGRDLVGAPAHPLSVMPSPEATAVVEGSGGCPKRT